MILILLLLCILSSTSSQPCQLPVTFNCSRSQPYCQGAQEIISYPETVYDCEGALNLTAEVMTISGIFTELNLEGAVISISNVSVVNGSLSILASQNLTISGYVEVVGVLGVYSNITYNSSESHNVTYYSETVVDEAQIKAKKMVIIGMKSVNISNSTIESTFKLCLYQSIDVNDLSERMHQYMDSMNVTGISQEDFGVFIYTSEIIEFVQVDVDTVSFLALSEDDITLVQANVNTSARSCLSNTGIGRGTNIQYQDSYCTSGSSSCGYGSISDPSPTCSNIIQYFMFLSHSFPYISKGPYLSTGSGGYGYNTGKEGAGGGIIFIFAKDSLLMADSNTEASGGSVDVENMLSAGSAGTIFISANSIYGYGMSNISAQGGNCSNNNGSGAGGLVKVSFDTAKDIELQTILWVNIYAGSQNNIPDHNITSNGIFYGVNCLPGFQSKYLRCEPCEPGYYANLGDPICKKCPSFNQLKYSNQSMNSQISQCYKARQTPYIYNWITPGDISLCTILLYLAVLIILTIVGSLLKRKIKKEKLASGDDFNIDEVKKDFQSAKVMAFQLRKSQQIKSYELMYHVHRISCFGTNTEESPWVLPLKVPAEMGKYVHSQVFTSFAESFNEEARWTKMEYWLTKLSVLVYPLYWYYMDRIKKRKYKNLLTKFQHAKDYNLLNNYGYEDKSILTIKFSKTKDYTNCYLDFFVYERTDIRYFILSSPFIIYFSGQGNFLRPFYLQEDDIFYRMMFFVVSRDIMNVGEGDEKSRLFSNMVSQKKRQKNSQQIVRFLRKLNTLACTLDLSAPVETIVSVLWSLAEFIDLWNRQFFNQVTVQVDMLIMISSLSMGAVIDNEVQVPTSKQKAQFKQNMTKKLSEHSHYQHTIKIALFVYNPQQEIPRQEQGQFKMQEQEISMQSMRDSIRESLISIEGNAVRGRQGMKRRKRSKLGIWARRLRYYMFSHQRNVYDEYTIKFLQSLFILMQTMLVFIWSVKLQLPYVFINLLCPLVGVVWFVSDSYGFGKLYLIFLSMMLVDEMVTLILYSIVESVVGESEMVVRNVVSCSVNGVIILLMMFVGKRAITLSKKLSLKSQDQGQQRLKIPQ